MSSESVLVTGGAGYIGSVTAWRLARAGRRVVVLDDLSTGHRDSARFGAFVEGDVGDADRVANLLAVHDVTAVVHFAAKALVAESVAHPQLYDEWNRARTERLVSVCVDRGVRAFVFSSSCAVYGIPEVVPISESHPRRPVNPYGASKAACEDALFASGLPAASLRYFNAAGAVPEAGLAERHDPETHLVPLAIRAAMGGDALTIFGTSHPTSDGTCVRDYVHVLDLADAHLAALARLEGDGASGTWNLGSGRGASIRDVVRSVERVVGRRVPVVDGPPRPGDPPVLVADADRARRDLGWRPGRSDLERIVADACACS